MNNTQKYIVGVALVVVAIIGFLGWKYPIAPAPLAGTSSQGSTFSSAKFYGVAVNLAAPGANGTSTSILNTDANDRYITSVGAACNGIGTSLTAYTGAGLASLTLKVATSSTAAPAANGNANVVGGTITISTSTAQWLLSTSTTATSLATTGGTSVDYIVWAANSYLTTRRTLHSARLALAR